MYAKIKILHGLDEYLRKNIIGQDHIITPWVTQIKHGYVGITKKDRPRGCFFLLGPTGTGKTELVNETVSFLYGKHNTNFLRLDMSEYSTLAGGDVLKKLLGYPGGDIGVLGRFLEQSSEGFILYDEFEKANPNLFTIMLQQVDSARITLSNHKTYDLSNFFIVCTSNVGARLFQTARHLSEAKKAEAALNELRIKFSPEFVARFGQVGKGILSFKKLESCSLRLIAKKFLDLDIARLQEFDITINGYNENIIEMALLRCTSEKNGAREIRSIIEDLILQATYQALEKGVRVGRIEIVGEKIELVEVSTLKKCV